MATMSTRCEWKEKMHFVSHFRDHQVHLDAKAESGGQDLGPSPKEIVLAAICGCSGMDVVSLLKKMRVEYSAFSVKAEAALTTGDYPIIFAQVDLLFSLEGPSGSEEKLKKSVELSMTKYCGVSAMIAKACPIHYKILFNQQMIHQGQAQF